MTNLLRPFSLALHSGQSASRLRSSNLRLIPGLEFAPLRHEDPARRQSIAPLIGEAMPDWAITSRPSPSREQLQHGARPQATTLSPVTSTDAVAWPAEPDFDSLAIALQEAEIPVVPEFDTPRAVGPEPITLAEEEEEEDPIESLARKLEGARIPVISEAERRPVFEPSIVSDTLANILVAQGAYSEALKAFQMLARMKPERLAHYQQRINEMKARIQRS